MTGRYLFRNLFSKSVFFTFFCLLLVFLFHPGCQNRDLPIRQGDYTIVTYYFPNYHPDPRNEKIHGPGWTEWDVMKAAQSRFEGHYQPRVPLWGYEDESEPAVMAKKIDAAADHGIDVFLFDWYYYDDGPFIQKCLENGFLNAENNDRIKFAIMWANHDWTHRIPTKLTEDPVLLYPGAVTRETWDEMTDHIVETYFKHPSYWLIDNKPFFDVHELSKMIQGLGGVEETLDAINSFRAKTKAAGFDDLHLCSGAGSWRLRLEPGAETVDAAPILDQLGFQSVTRYIWRYQFMAPKDEFPTIPYKRVVDWAVKDWKEYAQQFKLPNFPNVTMGWDTSPRSVQSDIYINKGGMFLPVIDGNTPQAFKDALTQMKALLDGPMYNYPHKILTINAFNEWTEGSYLEPDMRYKMGYLKAIGEVFGVKGSVKN